MSHARAAAARVPNDAYVTPNPLALAICAALRKRFGAWVPEEIIEPSAGDGAFIRAARASWPDAHITAVEIDSTRKSACLAAGAQVFIRQCWVETAIGLSNMQTEDGKPRLIVGNPPYRQAQFHIEAALRLLRDGDRLAYLLRLNFLGSSARVAFWRQGELELVQPIAPRPSFTNGGTDGTEYAVFVWRKGYRGAARLGRPLVWQAERAGRTTTGKR